MSFFRLENLVKRYGELVATDHASLEVRRGEIHALIGPNGAGKSTLIDLVTGLKTPDEGRVLLDDRDITRMPTHKRIQAGLSRCFQITSIFREMTVLDNLLLAVQGHEGSHMTFLRSRASERALETQARALAARVGLESVASSVAGTLAHAAQRQLDVALALASQPKLLLLDEPMAGMGPEDSERMTHLIRDLKRNMTILLIEHDMKAVFALADRLSVLVYGKVLVSGTVDEVRQDPRVQSVYLGNEESSQVPV